MCIKKVLSQFSLNPPESLRNTYLPDRTSLVCYYVLTLIESCTSHQQILLMCKRKVLSQFSLNPPESLRNTYLPAHPTLTHNNVLTLIESCTSHQQISEERRIGNKSQSAIKQAHSQNIT